METHKHDEPLGNGVPDGYAYVTTNGGFMPPTSYILWFPDNSFLKICDYETEVDRMWELARAKLTHVAPTIPLHEEIVITL